MSYNSFPCSYLIRYIESFGSGVSDELVVGGHDTGVVDTSHHTSSDYENPISLQSAYISFCVKSKDHSSHGEWRIYLPQYVYRHKE